jgi:hypothetical protein
MPVSQYYKNMLHNAPFKRSKRRDIAKHVQEVTYQSETTSDYDENSLK